MRQDVFTKVADASFVPVSVQDGHYSDLGNFMIARVQLVGELFMDTDADYTPVDGGVLYAVVPESYAGLHSEVQGSGGIYGETTVEYAILFAIMAEAPGGSFTEQEEKDVISMLSSFRVINLS